MVRWSVDPLLPTESLSLQYPEVKPRRSLTAASCLLLLPDKEVRFIVWGQKVPGTSWYKKESAACSETSQSPNCSRISSFC